jgi:hypothetical protein
MIINTIGLIEEVVAINAMMTSNTVGAKSQIARTINIRTIKNIE